VADNTDAIAIPDREIDAVKRPDYHRFVVGCQFAS
jgi:hypothetical protein